MCVWKKKKKSIIKATVAATEAADVKGWTCTIAPLFFSFSKPYHHDQQNSHEREEKGWRGVGGGWVWRKDRNEIKNKGDELQHRNPVSAD